MKRQLALLLTLVLACNLLLTGCIPLDKLLPCDHEWQDADCVNPLTCTRCGETAGTPWGHQWRDATCTEPKTCTICNETEGDPEEHLYNADVLEDASCQGDGTMRRACVKCGECYNETIPATTYTSVEIYDMFEESTGEVLTYDTNGNELALGTCVVYSADGKLITNYHVIEDAYSATVKIQGKSYDVQYVLAYDKNIDLAVLQINARGLIPAALCDESHATGSTVYAFGSSRGLEYTMSQGIITHADREMDGVRYVQHDAAISGGNSGGPLINIYGEVIGINTMTIRDSQNLNFAIHVSELENLSYGTKLTMRELYEKESNPFVRIANYIMTNGTWDTDGYYYVLLGTSYSSDYSSKYSRYAYYYPDTNEITIDLLIDDGDYWVYVTIDDSVSGVYQWNYFDDNDYKMSGTIYANSYDDNTLLGYSYNNISYASLRSSIRELASNMMNLLLLYMDGDLSDIGVTAYDLGFYNYG